MNLQATARRWLAEGRLAVVVEVTQAAGSVPRGVGTCMLVAADASAGTIGGGHLELKAIEAARGMLSATPIAIPMSIHYPLGPSLGQCCGGAVTLGFEPLTAQRLSTWPSTASRFYLQLYGAGHVGRAIAALLVPLDVQVDWIDARDEEFPAQLGNGPSGSWPTHIRKLAVDAVEAEVAQAPPGAFYLVLTHEHELDQRIAEAVLRRGDFGFLGLIGSKTKRQRFVHRFEARGLPAALIERMVCPIGVPGIAGKEPEVIAIAVLAQLLQRSG